MRPAAHAPAGEPAASPLRAKRLFVAGVAVGVIAMSATGLATAALIETPGQVAARSAAPPPTVISAVARWRVLAQTIAVAGKVTAARLTSVTASAPYRKVVVTRMPVRAGDVVRPGQVIAEVDGRPVLLLQGRLPAYRDLHEGDAGPDVAELQGALERLGYADFDPAGTFGESTALALALLYGRLGYRAPIFRPAPAPARRGTAIPDAYLPASEVTYVPARSALVVSVSAGSGTVPGARPIMRLATGNLYVSGALSQDQAALTRAGLPVAITSASPSLAAAGVLARISRLPSPPGPGVQGGTATVRYPIVVTGRRPLPRRLVGATVQLTLRAPVTAGPVLSVPLAAIFGGERHRSAYVIVVGPRGRRSRVPVFTGPVAGGLVAVESAGRAQLRPGARVEIGVGR